MLVNYYARCALDVLLCSYFGISSLCGLVFDSIRSILRHVSSQIDHFLSSIFIMYKTCKTKLSYKTFRAGFSLILAGAALLYAQALFEILPPLKDLVK